MSISRSQKPSNFPQSFELAEIAPENALKDLGFVGGSFPTGTQKGYHVLHKVRPIYTHFVVPQISKGHTVLNWPSFSITQVPNKFNFLQRNKLPEPDEGLSMLEPQGLESLEETKVLRI